MQRALHPFMAPALAFASGSLITFSLSPFDLWPLAILALSILHYLLADSSPRKAAWIGGLFGCGQYLSGAYWVYVSIHEHGGASPFLAGLMTAGFCIGIGLLLAPFTWVYSRRLQQTAAGATFGFAAIWLLNEWLKTWFLTGFPWLFVAYSQLDAPLAAWAPVTGTLGIGFILALTAAAISYSLRQRKPVWSLVLIALFWLAPFYAGTIQWTQPVNDKAYRVAMLQANIPQAQKWQAAYRPGILAFYRDTTQQLQDHDLVIWPETAIPEYLQDAGAFLAPIGRSSSAHGTALIFGIPSYQEQENHVAIYNTLATLGMAQGIYHKQKLVPFGEYVPLQSLLRGLIAFFDLPMSSFSPGPAKQPPLQAQDLTIMPYICYEVVYPDFVTRSAGKADVLLTVSNDTWFGESIGPIQHLQMARMRALETGRYMLRATNNGVTAIIGPDGSVIKRLPQFTRGVLTGEVYARRGLTPVMQYGTLPALILSILIVAGLMFRATQRSPV